MCYINQSFQAQFG